MTTNRNKTQTVSMHLSIIWSMKWYKYLMMIWWCRTACSMWSMLEMKILISVNMKSQVKVISHSSRAEKGTKISLKSKKINYTIKSNKTSYISNIARNNLVNQTNQMTRILRTHNKQSYRSKFKRWINILLLYKTKFSSLKPSYSKRLHCLINKTTW